MGSPREPGIGGSREKAAHSECCSSLSIGLFLSSVESGGPAKQNASDKRLRTEADFNSLAMLRRREPGTP